MYKTDHHDITEKFTVESGVKHHQTNNQIFPKFIISY